MLEKFKTLAATTCVAATAIVSVATQASAATLYTINQSPGNTNRISGTFYYDPASSYPHYSNVAISTSGGNTTTFPPTTYTTDAGEDPGYFEATAPSSQNGLPNVGFSSQLTGLPGDTEPATVLENSSGGNSQRSFTGVTVTSAAAAVPEPDGTSGIGLVILGGGGWLLKRKMAKPMKAKALSIQ